GKVRALDNSFRFRSNPDLPHYCPLLSDQKTYVRILVGQSEYTATESRVHHQRAFSILTSGSGTPVVTNLLQRNSVLIGRIVRSERWCIVYERRSIHESRSLFYSRNGTGVASGPGRDSAGKVSRCQAARATKGREAFGHRCRRSEVRRH